MRMGGRSIATRRRCVNCQPPLCSGGWGTLVGMGRKATGKFRFKQPERDDLSIQRGETSTTARPSSEDTLAARTTPQCPVEWRDAVTQLTHHKFASLTSLQVCKFVDLKTACVNSRVRPQLYATCLQCAHRVIGRYTAYNAALVTQLSKLDVH